MNAKQENIKEIHIYTYSKTEKNQNKNTALKEASE